MAWLIVVILLIVWVALGVLGEIAEFVFWLGAIVLLVCLVLSSVGSNKSNVR